MRLWLLLSLGALGAGCALRDKSKSNQGVEPSLPLETLLDQYRSAFSDSSREVVAAQIAQTLFEGDIATGDALTIDETEAIKQRKGEYGFDSFGFKLLTDSIRFEERARFRERFLAGMRDDLMTRDGQFLPSPTTQLREGEDPKARCLTRFSEEALETIHRQAMMLVQYRYLGGPHADFGFFQGVGTVYSENLKASLAQGTGWFPVVNWEVAGTDYENYLIRGGFEYTAVSLCQELSERFESTPQ